MIVILHQEEKYNMEMKWKQLLSTNRISCICGIDNSKSKSHFKDPRHPFERDWDQIIYSYPFRRLQDKTQVIPLPKKDFVHSRLTHSLEVSSVGRSLGLMLGNFIKKDISKLGFSPEHIGYLTAAACLCHDIGNPPFGHSGEDSISHYYNYILPYSGKPETKWKELKKNGKKYFKEVGQWNGENYEQIDMEVDFKSVISDHKKWIDLSNFEGNANGFNILANCTEKGVNPTFALLGAFSKYPRESWIITDHDNPDLRKENKSQSKYGFFQSDKEMFKQIAEDLGLIYLGNKDHGDYSWCRHPISFLMEAADDICYRMIDFEDGVRIGQIDFLRKYKLEFDYKFKGKKKKKSLSISPRQLLIEICKNDPSFNLKDLKEFKGEFKNELTFLRSNFINVLTHLSFLGFKDSYKEIMSAKFDKSLVEQIDNEKLQQYLEAMKALIKVNTYNSEIVLQTEAAGFEVIGSLLETFIDSANICFTCEPQEISPKQKKHLSLLPEEFRPKPEEDARDFPNMYSRLMRMNSYVAGMTDSYALGLFRKIKGIENVK